MRTKILLAGLLLFVVVALLAVYGSLSSRSTAPTLRIPNGAKISLIIADTAFERERGLGGRRALGEREGMLFMFPEAALHGFWMKGMEFPLDIVWLIPLNPPSKEGGREKVSVLRVVDVKENVATSTYPELFSPREEARYVLEVNTGVVARTGMRIGEILVLYQQ